MSLSQLFSHYFRPHPERGGEISPPPDPETNNLTAEARTAPVPSAAMPDIEGPAEQPADAADNKPDVSEQADSLVRISGYDKRVRQLLRKPPGPGGRSGPASRRST